MYNRISRFVSAWFPVILWMSFIYWLSSFHKLSVSEVSWQDFVTRKLAHITEYAILAGLIYRAVKHTSGLTANKIIVNAIILSVLYSISDEYHQTLVSGRTGRWFDIGIDSIGIIIGILISRFDILRRFVSLTLSFPRRRESI